MILPRFEYHAPRTVEDVVALSCGVCRLGLPLLITLSVLPVTLNAQTPDASTPPKVVVSAFTDSPITIDGVLDEAAWDKADPAADFVERTPSEGTRPEEATEVRVLYDKENIYFGFYCSDKTARKYVVRDLDRDPRPMAQDALGVVLDPFHDRRNGFLFATSPLGGWQDMQFANNGRESNLNWDGVWYVDTRIYDDHWTAEFAIPFKTLRFSKSPSQVFGVNFFRVIRRENQSSSWSPVPPRRGFQDVSYAGELRGIEGVEQGRNLTIKPYLLAGMNRFASRLERADGDFKGGVDVKYGLTSGLTLDLTVNTDFSQVEADTQQVNLTRFPLFFPEKREFFLENSGLFQFGETYALGVTRNNEVIPFFSRRIGLSPSGHPLPILGGARLTGRTGAYWLGLMNIQTRSDDATPANNYAVARIKRDILANSDVGAMIVNRRSSRPNDYNRLIGADINFRFFRNWKTNAFLAKTQTPGLEGQDLLGKIETQWDDGRIRFIASYLDIDENFTPEVGFNRRPGRRILHNEFGLRWNQRKDSSLGSLIRDVLPLIISDYSILPDGQRETNYLLSRLDLAFQDGGGLEIEYIRNTERLMKSFVIHGNISIPVGDYQFNQWLVHYFSDPTKALSIDAQGNIGDFYNGTKKTWTLSGKAQVGYRVAAAVGYEHNDITLREGAFRTDVVNLNLGYTFNPKMFLNALIQYNSATNQVSSNVRFRFMHHALSDFYVVYNEQRDPRHMTDRSLTAKYSHLLDF